MAYVKGLDLEKLICEVIFQNVTANLPSSFYLGIGHGTLPAKDATLSAVAALEVSGAGYSRLALGRNVTDFPTLALSGGDWKVTAKLLTWDASGDWVGNCDWIFLTDAASGAVGKFYGAVTLDDPFLMQSGDHYSDTFEYQDR